MKNSFFPSAVTEWNKIDKNIRKSESFNIFKKNILRFIRPSQNRVYNCHKPNGIKLLTTLRVELSQLREYKFKNSFQDTLNPIRTLLIRYELWQRYWNYILLHSSLSRLFTKKEDPLEHNQLYCSQYFWLKSFCMVKKILIILIIQAYCMPPLTA